ncbi:Sigma factor regulatory protein, FecR/PupR family {ECO:0000313/EMBL:CEA15104,1} [Petrimonas mucosa]|uniref:Sigma factor regulatory protein, FecR/PupR family n=2 Tax=Petrimonas mucosa TaxID=1642646 RepID=A0A1G4G6Z2_9BACT|nr:Sigma factor regulatory protein, FecR/PupR family {ECO:0000313/EMBL:CEA15104,1} [Petrimonas mucosa]
MKQNHFKQAGFTKFLQDEAFIEWKLFPSEELDTYWSNFLDRYPEERENFQMAEKKFSSIRISSHRVLPEKRSEPIKQLEQSLSAYGRKRRLRHYSYAAAISVALLILSLFYYNRVSGEMLSESGNYIVGNKLESEDILFVAGNQTSSFQGNVDLTIENEKTVRVRGENNQDAEISIEQDVVNKLIVPYGKRSKIILSDGSRVWLNSGSVLEFPCTFSGEKREVILHGEMYIEVEPDPDRSFVVHTADFDVKVHGTRFNVTAYRETSASVVLVEGKVGLNLKDGEELLLSPREQGLYSGSTGTFTTRVVDVDAYISWKEGYLMFEDTPVTEALRKIERYYNLSFNLDENVSFCGLTCTGKIILSANLDNVMTALSVISNTEYKRDDNMIYIFKKSNN